MRYIINNKLLEYKDYFDHMFEDVDKNIILDEDYLVIIAGAGSGKTTTMVAKVKCLVEKKNVKPK